MESLHKRLERIEYHQRLLAKCLTDEFSFTKLIVLKDLSAEEVEEFLKICENLNNELEEQRAEGFVCFHPLLKEFQENLNEKLNLVETVDACLKQRIFPELMGEFMKLLND